MAQEKGRFQKTLTENGIQNAYDEGVKKIGRERQAVLVARVSEDDFLRIVKAHTPPEIPYEMVHMTDVDQVADFYARLNRIGQHFTYEQHWGKLTLAV